jgi:Pentapeptide repeats (9 copies)
VLVPWGPQGAAGAAHPNGSGASARLPDPLRSALGLHSDTTARDSAPVVDCVGAIMKVMPKDVAAAGFDLAAWHEELLALNPWARGLTIDGTNAEFAAARQKATLARHAEGKDVWNAWANGMLALKAAHEAHWLALASAVFSTEVLTHCLESDVSFDQSIFPSDASFDSATLSGDALFGSATFSGDAIFESATFSRDAFFGSATFSGNASFDSATFSRDAFFGSATFSRDAFFGSATFSGPTLLTEVRFNADADFRHAKFEKPVTFARSIFRQAANFEGIDSVAAFSLTDATFNQVPSFIGAAFKGKVRLDNVETPRDRWTFGYTPDKDATARFRELRRQAAEAQDRERELEFFAQEIRTGRFHGKGLPSWVPKVWSWRFWFGLGFGAFSNFGRSLSRPLLLWLALTALFAAFYLGEHEDMRNARDALAPSGRFGTLTAHVATTRDALANPPACRVEGEPFDSADAVTEAIQLSLKNALVFDVGRTDSGRRTFGCLYGLVQDGAPVPWRVSIASTLQALASGLLIFLFLLAVRNLLRLH